MIGRLSVAVILVVYSTVARGETILSEDFEDANVRARGWYDVRGWSRTGELYIARPPEVKPRTGRACLRLGYKVGDCGPWMHIRFKKGVREAYVRYYRYFPRGWVWPKGYGPHDTYLFAGSFGAPTDTDLTIYLDFFRTGETFVRVATARQKWGYGGYATKVLARFRDKDSRSGGVNRLPYNVAKPDKIALGRWHCIEYAAKLSDPGKKNGRLRLWVNGKLVSDLDKLPLVDEKHGGILFNHFMIGPYFHGGSPKRQVNYLDALVVSTEYIGPLEQAGGKTKESSVGVSPRKTRSSLSGKD